LTTSPAAARCPRCGRPLRGATLEGLCPACLMRQALTTGDMPDATHAATDAAPDPRVTFTSFLTTSAWTLVTLLADDEECVTYLARESREEHDSRLAQLVVRKPHVPATEAEEVRQQLRRRLMAFRKLRHPGLAPVLDGGLTEDGHPFLATAFVMAAPLVDLDMEGIAAEILRNTLDQAREALQALHEAGLAHGRIRTSTVLARRTRGGATAVVTGFAPVDPLPLLSNGIADDLERFQRLTTTLRV
jgi:hypothetical protein